MSCCPGPIPPPPPSGTWPENSAYDLLHSRSTLNFNVATGNWGGRVNLLCFPLPALLYGCRTKFQGSGYPPQHSWSYLSLPLRVAPFLVFLLHPYCRKLGTVSYSVYLLTQSIWASWNISFSKWPRTQYDRDGKHRWNGFVGTWRPVGYGRSSRYLRRYHDSRLDLNIQIRRRPMRQFFNRLSNRTFSPSVSAEHSDGEVSIT